jgi:hypothetical protein
LNSNKVLRLKPDVDVNDANDMPPLPATTR